jgi:hypothetical protein
MRDAEDDDLAHLRMILGHGCGSTPGDPVVGVPDITRVAGGSRLDLSH